MTDKIGDNIPWTRMAVEGAVIVSSILLAFFIDAFWETRREEQQEIAVLLNLENQFSTGIPVLNNVLRILGDRENYAKQLLELSNSTEVSPPEDILTALGSIFLTSTTLNLPSGALESYLASGNSELIRNSELRNLLATWTSLVNELSEEEATTRQHIETELRPFLMSRIQLGPLYSAHPANIFGEFPSKEIDLGSIKEILEDPVFANHVTTRLARLRIEQREVNNLHAAAIETLRLLRLEIE